MDHRRLVRIDRGSAAQKGYRRQRGGVGGIALKSHLVESRPGAVHLHPRVLLLQPRPAQPFLPRGQTAVWWVAKGRQVKPAAPQRAPQERPGQEPRKTRAQEERKRAGK